MAPTPTPEPLPSKGGSYVRQGDSLERMAYTAPAPSTRGTQPPAPSGDAAAATHPQPTAEE